MPEQDILRTELRWGLVVAGAVGVIIAVIILSSFFMALEPPSHVERIDPLTLAKSAEFAENNLGTYVNSDGSAVVRAIATQFTFVPRCIAAPQGQPVTIRITSPDVIHGFIIAGTNANTMVVPGYVSQLRVIFPDAGKYLMPCHEYCGLGHSEMWGVVQVFPENQLKPDKNGKVSCASSG